MSTRSTFRWLLWLALLLTAPAQAAFTDNGNGTVTDTVTGLMWDQCSWGQTWGAGSGPGNRSCAGTASIHDWAASLNLANTANTGNRRGYTDWRLPNRTELESLVDINKNASPRIDSVAFPNTPSFLFWSSTLYLSINPAYARYVNFNDGNTQHSIQTSTYHVRFVRGGQSFDPLGPAYALSYAANSGTGTPPTASNHAAGSLVTTSNGSWATRPGYTLTGWNTAAAGTGTAVALGGSLTMPAEATTLYAQWTANPAYPLSYDANSGSGSAPATANHAAGSLVTTSNGTWASRPGYTLTGWNTAAAGTGTAVALSGSLTMTAEATTLYAQWTANTQGPTGLLNDTGQTRCLNVAGSALDACSETNTGNASTRPGQDGRFGRDPAAGNPGLSGFSKPAGSGGSGGFAFTPLDVNGTPIALTGATPPVPSATPRCIKDNVTNLIWEVKTDDAGLQDKDWTYGWGVHAGICFVSQVPSGCNTVNYITALNAASVCPVSGAGPWRLPTRRELESIIDHNLSSFPVIDTSYFPNMPAANRVYWSSDVYAVDQSLVWHVDFLAGDSNVSGRSGGNRVRLVRDGP